jgi:CRISPR-associated protein Cpf1
MNDRGEFFDSRKSGQGLPENADANGAYNIALKGLWVLQQIRQSKDQKDVKLAISNKEWLQFAQQKPYLKD